MICTQKSLILSVYVHCCQAKQLEAKCDSHPSSSEPTETTAAAELSLSPDGQSAAYQSAYGLQWKTKRLLRDLGDNTKD